MIYTTVTKSWITFALLFTCFFVENFHSVEIEKPYWRASDKWSNCSEPCGAGKELSYLDCYKLSRTHQEVSLDPEQCEATIGERPHLARQCNLGRCSSRYRWHVGDWGVCSQHCGPQGTMSREVQCVYEGSQGLQVIPERNQMRYCVGGIRPKERIACNQIDCPPRFQPEEWDKCIQGDPCMAGRQNRKMICVRDMLDGSILDLPMATCYMARKQPLPTWRRCYIPSLTEKCETLSAEIDTLPMTVVQMRKHRRLKLQVGQHAFVIPYTRITVKCPVKFFSSQDLIWLHEERGRLRYMGHSKERIRVDKQGRLHIKNFKVADKGEWHCLAGDRNATITLRARTPAEGFHDWARRTSLWNNKEVMLNEDPKTAVTNQVLVQWVEGPWSECSVSCGAEGIQTRVVRCERVDTRVYHILEDKVCNERMLPKPSSQRKCANVMECPKWNLTNADYSQCTDRCIGVNLGTIKGHLSCQVGDRIVPNSECEETEKPNIECPNPVCQIEWKTSPWSRCSKSCGSMGVQARTMRCVWSHSGEFARSLCYETGLDTPEVIRPCQPPPCVLDCVDLSPHCSKKVDLCQFSMFRFHCCKTCNEMSSSGKAISPASAMSPIL